MSKDPLDLIRLAVLQAADAGADPTRVSALLLRISAEVAITTSSMGEEQWKTLADAFWDRALQEQYPESKTSAEA